MFATRKASETPITQEIQPTSAALYSPKSLLQGFLLTAAYSLGSHFLTGLRGDQVALAVVFNLCFFGSAISRKFIIGFSIFLLYWIIFDWMKAFPNYLFNDVSIRQLYEAEKALFGIGQGAATLTPNEYFAQHTSNVVDLLAGIFYIAWVPLPWGLAVYLFFKNRPLFFQYACSFFLMNLIGFIGYYTYPAAPPWYVAQHGFDFIANTPGSTAGLARFDALTGTQTFASIYSKSSNVFAAMPSMHAGDILLATIFVFKNKTKAAGIVFALFALGIWFGALYTSHHYLLDVLAGIFCALVALIIFQWFVNKTEAGKKMMAALMKHTEFKKRLLAQG